MLCRSIVGMNVMCVFYIGIVIALYAWMIKSDLTYLFIAYLCIYSFFYFLVAVGSYDLTNFNENWLRFVTVCFLVYVTVLLQLCRLCNVEWDEDVLWSILSGIGDEIKIYYAMRLAGFKTDSWNQVLLNMKFECSPLSCVYSYIQVTTKKCCANLW